MDDQRIRLHDGIRACGQVAFRKQVIPLYREAMPYMERAHELDPNNDDVTNALRNIYYKLGEGRKLEALDRK